MYLPITKHFLCENSIRVSLLSKLSSGRSSNAPHVPCFRAHESSKKMLCALKWCCVLVLFVLPHCKCLLGLFKVNYTFSTFILQQIDLILENINCSADSLNVVQNSNNIMGYNKKTQMSFYAKFKINRLHIKPLINFCENLVKKSFLKNAFF